MTSRIAIELAITILISGSLFALCAIGFTLMYRVTKILHLAHGAIVLASGYAFWWALHRGASTGFAILFTIAVALAIGWCMHTFVYEHLRKRGSVATTMSLIATLALLVLVQNILLALFGSRTLSVSIAELLPALPVGNASLTGQQVLLVITSLVIIVGVFLFLRRSRLGKSMRAVSDNAIAAEVVGIDVARVRLAAILLASFTGGVAGILYAMEFNLDPSMGIAIALASFSRAVIGGIGSLPGAFFGSFVIESVEDIGAFYYSAGLKIVFSFVIVFLFLLFKPRGLFGEKVRREDL